MKPIRITYDSEAEALYIYLRESRPQRTEGRGEDIFVDFDAQGIVGIEVLDTDADLSSLIHEFGLDPHLLDVLAKLRPLLPEATKELVLA